MSNKAISVYAEAMKRQAEEIQVLQPESQIPVPISPISENTVTPQTDEVSKQVNMFTSKKVNKKVSKQVNKSTSKHEYVNQFLYGKAQATVSFRLPPEIMDKFDEVYYSVKGRFKSEVKKYDVVVAALALFFQDFEENDRESDLYKLLIESKNK